ncbi:MFS transporter [Salinispora pacifica]|uniref:MFS transporter n=1 Tax=Salinispora pacifica TaxID=351187 RepID=UPI00035C7CB0|nr:MFS transporter [Salinispora pacifica]
MDSAVAPPIRAGRREIVALTVLMLPTILVALDRSVLYLALPHIGADLGASSLQQLWITDIHDFMIAGLLVTMGTLGDRIGRKRLLFLGLVGFAAASLFAAYATSAGMLIVARALVGIAGSTIMPSTMALISAMFRDRRQHTTAIAVWMGCFTAGTAIGPLIGGALIEHLWWGAAFLIGVPVTLLTVLLGARLLPERRSSGAGRVDLVSVAMSLLAVLSLVYGLKQLSRTGVDATVLTTVAVGIVAGVLFVLRQRRLASPLLDVRLFRSRALSSALVLTLCVGVVSGTILFVYLYLQTVAGLSPMATALWLLPSTLTSVVVIQIAPLVVRRIRPAFAIAAGLVVQAGGYLLLTQVDNSGQLGLLVTGTVVTGIGLAPLAALGASLTLQSAPAEKAGSAASLTETSGELGIALGIATIGVFGTAAYQNSIQLDPALPESVAAAARDSAAGAFSVAGGLPAEQSQQLFADVFDAITTSLHTTALASALVALAAAVVAVTMLRHVPPSSRPYHGDGVELTPPAPGRPADVPASVERDPVG